MYSPDDCLAISGLQHFRFCCRQWALIHIGRQWAENLRTAEGASCTSGRTTSFSAKAAATP